MWYAGEMKVNHCLITRHVQGVKHDAETEIFAAGLGLLLAVTAAAAETDRLVEQIGTGGHVLMIRHANAPGNQEPDHFRIGACSTQRNLDEQGRSRPGELASGFAARVSRRPGSTPASGVAASRRLRSWVSDRLPSCRP